MTIATLRVTVRNDLIHVYELQRDGSIYTISCNGLRRLKPETPFSCDHEAVLYMGELACLFNRSSRVIRCDFVPDWQAMAHS